MKLFSVRGGVHPPTHKNMSANESIKAAPLPPKLLLPMHQHIGIAAEPMVAVGQQVKKGQLLGVCAGGYICRSGVTSPVHAPTSGVVSNIEMLVAPHPSGLDELMVEITPDGLDEWGELPPPLDPNASTIDDLSARIHQSGVVGLGGATFPTAAKLDARKSFVLHTLILNGAECEPYLTADDRLMREAAGNIIDGAMILRQILNVPQVIIAIEDNKGEALKAMREASGAYPQVQVAAVPTRYPMGSEKHLIQALTGRETPAGRLPASLGIIVNNVATAYAAHQAVRFGQPLISRVITVSGGAIRQPGNYETRIGTPVSFLVEHCGGFKQQPEKLLLGGPMMGQPLTDPGAPVVKGTNGVLALTRKEVNPGLYRPCIRCGACVTACPCGLEPLRMAKAIRAEKLDGLGKLGLSDCVLCGSCSYVCPSHIPLVQYFNYGKGRLLELRQEEAHAAELKRLSDERNERVRLAEEEKRLKAEARKKKLAAAKMKAEAKAEAQAADAGAGAEAGAPGEVAGGRTPVGEKVDV